MVSLSINSWAFKQYVLTIAGTISGHNLMMFVELPVDLAD